MPRFVRIPAVNTMRSADSKAKCPTGAPRSLPDRIKNSPRELFATLTSPRLLHSAAKALKEAPLTLDGTTISPHATLAEITESRSIIIRTSACVGSMTVSASGRKSGRARVRDGTMASSAHGFAPVVEDESEGSVGGGVRGRSILGCYGCGHARCVFMR